MDKKTAAQLRHSACTGAALFTVATAVEEALGGAGCRHGVKVDLVIDLGGGT